MATVPLAPLQRAPRPRGAAVALLSSSSARHTSGSAALPPPDEPPSACFILPDTAQAVAKATNGVIAMAIADGSIALLRGSDAEVMLTSVRGHAPAACTGVVFLQQPYSHAAADVTTPPAADDDAAVAATSANSGSQLLASCGEDGMLRVWQLADAGPAVTLVATLPAVQPAPSAAATAATAAAAPKARAPPVPQLSLLTAPHRSSAPVSVLAAAAAGRHIYLWPASAAAAAPGAVVIRAPAAVDALAFDPAAGSLLAALEGGVAVWSAALLSEIMSSGTLDAAAAAGERGTLLEYSGWLRSLALSSCGRWIAAGSHEDSLHVWDTVRDVQFDCSGGFTSPPTALVWASVPTPASASTSSAAVPSARQRGNKKAADSSSSSSNGGIMLVSAGGNEVTCWFFNPQQGKGGKGRRGGGGGGGASKKRTSRGAAAAAAALIGTDSAQGGLPVVCRGHASRITCVAHLYTSTQQLAVASGDVDGGVWVHLLTGPAVQKGDPWRGTPHLGPAVARLQPPPAASAAAASLPAHLRAVHHVAWLDGDLLLVTYGSGAVAVFPVAWGSQTRSARSSGAGKGDMDDEDDSDDDDEGDDSDAEEGDEGADTDDAT